LRGTFNKAAVVRVIKGGPCIQNINLVKLSTQIGDVAAYLKSEN
jgi:hypothetical protein